MYVCHYNKRLYYIILHIPIEYVSIHTQNTEKFPNKCFFSLFFKICTALLFLIFWAACTQLYRLAPIDLYWNYPHSYFLTDLYTNSFFF